MQIKNDRLAPEAVALLLRYESETGKLFWLHRKETAFAHLGANASAICKMWNRKFAGKEAFTAAEARGYRRGNIFGRTYEAHRVCWAIHHGKWPEAQIDHIDGDPTNNRIENLRDASRTEQARNAAMPSTNRSGVVGVCWDRERGKWAAFIHLNNKVKHLGRFANFDAAVSARKTAEREYGFHPNHGRNAA